MLLHEVVDLLIYFQHFHLLSVEISRTSSNIFVFPESKELDLKCLERAKTLSPPHPHHPSKAYIYPFEVALNKWDFSYKVNEKKNASGNKGDGLVSSFLKFYFYMTLHKIFIHFYVGEPMSWSQTLLFLMMSLWNSSNFGQTLRICPWKVRDHW